MRKNKFLANLKAGRKTSVCQLYFPSATVVELIGLAGLDCVLFDGEHGTFTPQDLDDLCRVAELGGLDIIARVPEISSSTIQSYLDRGVMGIFGPGVDTKEDAQRLVDACRYAPIGKRGIGGAPRWLQYGNIASRAQIEEANSELLVAAFLEHVDALDNLDDIMSVEGIDAYYVGPADMSLSLGLPGELDHPRVKEVENTVRKAALARGKCYLGDGIAGVRATNMFLDGAKLFLEANRAALS